MDPDVHLASISMDVTFDDWRAINELTERMMLPQEMRSISRMNLNAWQQFSMIVVHQVPFSSLVSFGVFLLVFLLITFSLQILHFLVDALEHSRREEVNRILLKDARFDAVGAREQAKAAKIEADKLMDSLEKIFADLMRWREELQSANAKLVEVEQKAEERAVGARE